MATIIDRIGIGCASNPMRVFIILTAARRVRIRLTALLQEFSMDTIFQLVSSKFIKTHAPRTQRHIFGLHSECNNCLSTWACLNIIKTLNVCLKRSLKNSAISSMARWLHTTRLLYFWRLMKFFNVIPDVICRASRRGFVTIIKNVGQRL